MLSIWIRGRKAVCVRERASESKSRHHLSKWLKLAKMLRLPSNHHYAGKNIIIYNTIMKQSPHASSKWLYFGRKLHNFEQWRANFVDWASGKRRVSEHGIHQKPFYIQRDAPLNLYYYYGCSHMFWWQHDDVNIYKNCFFVDHSRLLLITLFSANSYLKYVHNRNENGFEMLVCVKCGLLLN